MSALTHDEEDIDQRTGKGCSSQVAQSWESKTGLKAVLKMRFLSVGLWLGLLEFGPEQVGFGLWKSGSAGRKDGRPPLALVKKFSSTLLPAAPN